MAEEQNKYLNLDGLTIFLSRLKEKFAPITHKHKIADIEDYKVDSELLSTSTNPVQNKAVVAKINSIETAAGAKTKVQFVKWESGD